MLAVMIAVGVELGRAVALVVAGEQRALVVLVGEGLDDADAADVLLDAGVEVADPAGTALRQFCVMRAP